MKHETWQETLRARRQSIKRRWFLQDLACWLLATVLLFCILWLITG